MEIDFEVLSVDTPEIIQPNETAEAYSTRITQEKMHAAWDKIQHEKLPILPILCADTEVVLDGVVLGKPRDEEDAFNMLKKLSGRTHLVITSVGVKFSDDEKILTNNTKVTFDIIPDHAIRHYLATGEYRDKSGSYGIQGYIGQYISEIQGCFYAVMGLPLNSVRRLISPGMTPHL
jgi:septum formation protein